MLPALHTGHPGMDVGKEVAAVQVPPDSLIGMVMQPAIMAALRTGPPQPLPVFEMDVDPLPLRIEVDALDRPGRIYAEKSLCLSRNA